MAPPVILEDQSDTYYYLIVKKDLFDLPLFKDINKVPVSVISLPSTSNHASGTGYSDASGNSNHPDIKYFICPSGILIPPGDSFGFEYLSLYPGVSGQQAIDASDIGVNITSSLSTWGSDYINKLNSSDLIFKYKKIYGPLNQDYYFVEKKGETNKTIGRFESLDSYNYFVDVYTKSNQKINFIKLIGNYKFTNSISGKKIEYLFRLENKVLNRELYIKESENIFNLSSFVDSPILYPIDSSAINTGARLSDPNFDYGSINLGNYYITLQNNGDYFSTENLPPKKDQIIKMARVLKTLQGRHYFSNIPDTLTTKTSFDGSILKLGHDSSGNLEVSNTIIPKVSLSGINNSIESIFLNVLTDYISESNINNSLTLSNYINLELAKKEKLYNSIIFELLKLSGALG